MSTMKLDLSEWKNLAVGHMRALANSLDQAALLRPGDMERIDAHWANVIRPRLAAWDTESAIAIQEQQRMEAAQPPPPPEIFNGPHGRTDLSLTEREAQANGATEPPKKKGGWQKGRPRKPKPAVAPPAVTM